MKEGELKVIPEVEMSDDQAKLVKTILREMDDPAWQAMVRWDCLSQITRGMPEAMREYILSLADNT